MVDYFTNIFKSNDLSDVSLMVNAIKPVVTDVMNIGLTQDFQVAKVIKALKHMHPKKALGPDGMPPLFYQHYWFLVGNCVTKTVLYFLNHDIRPPNFNETHVVLIPKIKTPTKITKFRPISLSNVISKLALRF